MGSSKVGRRSYVMIRIVYDSEMTDQTQSLVMNQRGKLLAEELEWSAHLTGDLRAIENTSP